MMPALTGSPGNATFNNFLPRLALRDLVSPVGNNGRVDPNVTLTTKSGTTKYVANETPVANRRPILDAYKVKAGKVVEGYFRKLPDPADHPVITLTPVT